MARAARPGEINYEPIDKWTLGHMAVGLVMGRMGFSIKTASLVAVGWELLERPLKDEYPEFFPTETQDSAVNATMDALAMLGGYWIARGKA